MTAVLAAPPAPAVGGTVGLGSVLRVEWRKLSSQLAVRILALVCVLGPIAYVVVLKTQSGTPTDALLGVWAHTSGFAVIFVLLVFTGSWGFPVLAGVVAGDSFASEDRYGTWKTVLTRSCSRGAMFVGKVLAVAAMAELLVAIFAVSGVVTALLIVGHQPTVGVSGNVIQPGHAAALVAAAWVWSMLPVLAFVALGVLFSVATASGIAGVLGPILVGFAMQLLALVGGSVWTHLLLVGSAFDGWHAIVAQHPYYRPLIVSALVCVVWTAASLGVAWTIFRRREFADAGTGRRGDWSRVVRAVAVGLAALVLVALACTWGPTAITAERLQDSVTHTFNNLTIYQQQLLGRRVASGAQLRAFTSCARRGHASSGPGDDWLCTIAVYSGGASGGLQQFNVHYDVTVQSNGCYRADGPPNFVGAATLTLPSGRTTVNPLFQFYGCFDTL